jgi:isochorismate hydrolase
VTVVGSATVPATPYPWPFHGRLQPGRTALVVCCDCTWRPARADADAADAALATLRAAAAEAGIVTVEVTVLPRPVTSGFYGSRLDDTLRGAGTTDLLLAGWGLEGPVHSTLRAANDRGYECLLVADACAAQDPELAFAALDMVRHSGGIFGAFAQVKDITTVLRRNIS